MSSSITIVEYPSTVTIQQDSSISIAETVAQIDINETNSNVSISQTNVVEIAETPATITVNQNSVEVVQVGVMGP